MLISYVFVIFYWFFNLLLCCILVTFYCCWHNLIRHFIFTTLRCFPFFLSPFSLLIPIIFLCFIHSSLSHYYNSSTFLSNYMQRIFISVFIFVSYSLSSFTFCVLKICIAFFVYTGKKLCICSFVHLTFIFFNLKFSLTKCVFSHPSFLPSFLLSFFLYSLLSSIFFLRFSVCFSFLFFILYSFVLKAKHVEKQQSICA